MPVLNWSILPILCQAYIMNLHKKATSNCAEKFNILNKSILGSFSGNKKNNKNCGNRRNSIKTNNSNTNNKQKNSNKIRKWKLLSNNSDERRRFSIGSRETDYSQKTTRLRNEYLLKSGSENKISLNNFNQQEQELDQNLLELNGSNNNKIDGDLSRPTLLSSDSFQSYLSRPTEFDYQNKILNNNQLKIKNDGRKSIFGETPLQKVLSFIDQNKNNMIQPKLAPNYLEPNSNFTIENSLQNILTDIAKFLDSSNVDFKFKYPVKNNFNTKSATTKNNGNDSDSIVADSSKTELNQYYFQCDSFEHYSVLMFNIYIYLDFASNNNNQKNRYIIEFQRRNGNCLQLAELYNNALRELKKEDNLNISPLNSERISEDYPSDIEIVRESDDVLQNLNAMALSDYSEDQYESSSSLAYLSSDDSNCCTMIDFGTLDTLQNCLKDDRDFHVQRCAAAAVANMISGRNQQEISHVKQVLHQIAHLLMNLLLTSPHLEVLREAARALVALSEVNILLNPNDNSQQERFREVLYRLEESHDNLAIQYRNCLLLNAPIGCANYYIDDILIK